MSNSMSSGLAGKKALVFGANGYLGRHLTYHLMQAGCSVKACDVQSASAVAGVEYSPIDVTSLDALKALDWNVDYVYVFAGITGTQVGFEQFERFVHINELGLLNVLTATRAASRRPQIIFPSTRLVYEGSELPLREEAPKKPKTIYAINKLACEHILESYREAFGVPFTIFRICVPYGNVVGSGYSYGLTGAFIKQARENSVITLFGDGLLRRTLTHVEDICRDIVEATADPRSIGEVFNVPGETFALKEVATLIASRYRATLSYRDWPESDLKIESGHTVFDGDKLRRLNGRPAQHSFASWIRQAPDI